MVPEYFRPLFGDGKGRLQHALSFHQSSELHRVNRRTTQDEENESEVMDATRHFLENFLGVHGPRRKIGEHAGCCYSALGTKQES